MTRGKIVFVCIRHKKGKELSFQADEQTVRYIIEWLVRSPVYNGETHQIELQCPGQLGCQLSTQVDMFISNLRDRYGWTDFKPEALKEPERGT